MKQKMKLKDVKNFPLSWRRGQRTQMKSYKTHKCKLRQWFKATTLLVLFLVFILAKIDFGRKGNANDLIKKESNKMLQSNLQLFNQEHKRAASLVVSSKKMKQIRREVYGKALKLEELQAKEMMPVFRNAPTTLTANVEETPEQMELDMERLYTESVQLNFARDNVTKTVPYSAAAIKCRKYRDNCTLSCSEGSVDFIAYDLKEFQAECKMSGGLSLAVAQCVFNYATLEPSFFYGAFGLEFLSICKCNLQIIKAGTFQHSNAKNLKTLLLSHNHLISLRDSTFDGLSNLLHFQFVQAPLGTIFKGEGFLKPLANNLQQATIQPIINGTEQLDPLNWWRQLQMNSLLILDVSNTNLQGILGPGTFQPFVVLEHLILSNCQLNSIKVEVFEFMATSLKHLDLRFNHLKTLEYDFLQKLIFSGLVLNLSFNEWSCECTTGMLQYFAQQSEDLTEDILCFTPPKWQQMKLTQVIEECRNAALRSTATTTRKVATLPILSTTVATTTVGTLIPLTSTKRDSLTSPTDMTHGSSMPPLSTTNRKLSSTEVALESSTEMTAATSTNFTILMCDSRNEFMGYSYELKLMRSDVNFSLQIMSSTSVSLKVQQSQRWQQFFVLYFTSPGNYSLVAHSETVEELQNATKFVETFYIKDLRPSMGYMFCVIVPPANVVSPFDCRAHFMEHKDLETVWLLQSDQLWFIAANATAAIFIFLLAIAVAYLLLRLKPQWLRKCCKYVLQPKRGVKPIGASKGPGPWSISQRSSFYLSSPPPPLEDTCTNVAETMIYSSQHSVPCVMAPNSPLECEHHCSAGPETRNTCSRLRESPPQPQRMGYFEVIDVDPDYQTIDHYEAMYHDVRL